MSAKDIPENEILEGNLAASKEELDDLAAIRAGIADMEAGRFRPLAESDTEFRLKFGIPKPENKQVKV